jgi:hypothetical protein
MGHDPEALAAAYLTDMAPQARARHDQHLLTCETCWREVSLARRGRELAESTRRPAPAGLREHLRASITTAAETDAGRRAAHPPRATPHRPGLILAVTAAAVALVTAASIWHLRPSAPDHTTTAAIASTQTALEVALADFRNDRLPGTAVPPEPAPDLIALGMRLIAAGTGRLDQVDVTMYAYRTPSGSRLVLYRSTRSFPEADQAREIPGAETAWSLQSGDVTVLCGPDTHTMLLLGTDPATVHQVGGLLNLT